MTARGGAPGQAGRTRRLFFALWPSAAEREALVRAAQPAIEAVRGRPVPPGNLHVTLAFLGTTSEERLRELAAAATAVAAGDASRPEQLEVRLDRLEHWRRAGVLCATPGEPPHALSQLAGALREALVAARFDPDPKPFNAHVTLMRKVAQAAALPALAPVRWRCREIVLVESRTTPSGPLYSTLESWPLGKV